MSAKYSKITIEGVVQGVGFRPFVYRLANEMGLKGWVKNTGGKVEIVINTDECEVFLSKIKSNAPIHSHIHNITLKEHKTDKSYKTFEILQSSPHQMPKARGIKQIQQIEFHSISKDIAICQECLKDIKNPKNRHYQYAFTSCTNCGPRYSIINSFPYDRANTTMSPFRMCQECQKEYENPLNRRFHAQINSCPNCAISMKFIHQDICSFNHSALLDCIKAIKKGDIVAIKGIGGFALVCDGRNDKAISRLRNKKNRPKKPFALMVKNIAMAEEISNLSHLEIEALTSAIGPIVLGIKKASDLYSPLVAPNLHTIGILLPYSGIHHLLFEEIDFPIVFTSANLSGEPIISSYRELEDKMSNIVDGVLDYNREIVHSVDDSVLQMVAGQMRVVRLARGLSPLDIELKGIDGSKKCIGMGAEQKLTLTYSVGNKYMISPYIGDLDNPSSMERYEKTLDFFSEECLGSADVFVSDLHQNYHSSTISAKKSTQLSCNHIKIQHHHAHFCAIFAEAMMQNQNITLETKAIGIIWDGTGLGDDGNIWGGEIFVGNLKEIKRVGHFEEFCLLGGEGAIKNIYKIGYALALQFGAKEIIQRYEEQLGDEAKILRQMFEKKINLIKTTSVGRLFDGIANLCGLLDKNTFEAESGMLLESLSLENGELESSQKVCYDFAIEEGVVLISEMILQIQKDILSTNIAKVARSFIYTLANIALCFAKKYPFYPVLFSGGVFQNKILCEDIKELFDSYKIEFYMHKILPPNDMNISFGQAFYAQNSL